MMTTQRLSTTSTAGLLIFDGDCAFCTTWVNRLSNWLPNFPETQPYQWLDIDAYGLTTEDVENYAWYISPSRQFAGHLAFSAILRSQQGFGYRFLGHLMATFPFSIAASLGYSFVAANRHRLPGGTPACAMKPPANLEA
jgi:predicted DCC family thiol-disulfide oxidoreductase YuxK